MISNQIGVFGQINGFQCQLFQSLLSFAFRLLGAGDAASAKLGSNLSYVPDKQEKKKREHDEIDDYHVGQEMTLPETFVVYLPDSVDPYVLQLLSTERMIVC